MPKKRCPNCKKYNYDKDALNIKGRFYCDMSCAVSYASKNKDKGRKIKHREQKKNFRLTDTAKQHELTQKSFNKLRVLQEMKWFKDRGLDPECISCKGVNKDWCCGHFKTRGSQGNLRYDFNNTFLQCNRYCNMALSGNIEGNKSTRGYKQGLIDRFGEAKAREIIDYCETNTKTKKWTGEELVSMRKEFNKEIKNLIE